MNLYQYFVSRHICTFSFFLSYRLYSHSLSDTHHIKFLASTDFYVRNYKKTFNIDILLSLNFVLGEFVKCLNAQSSSRNKNIMWGMVKISINFTDSYLLMAPSVVWSITYELGMDIQQSAVLRSRVVCHTVLRCVRCAFCNFISGTILIAYECVERHSIHS
jgi:hypothetical protein